MDRYYSQFSSPPNANPSRHFVNQHDQCNVNSGMNTSLAAIDELRPMLTAMLHGRHTCMRSGKERTQMIRVAIFMIFRSCLISTLGSQQRQKERNCFGSFK
jgi:hypothetical protein